MPQDPEAAAEAIATGEMRAVDVGKVNGRIFVNHSLLGAYPYMVLERERRRRMHGLGKWAAMSWAFLRMLKQFPRRRLSICAEGWTKPYRTPLLFVGVNEYNMELLTLHRLHGLDGELWLMVAKHGSPQRFLWFAARTTFSGFDAEGDFEFLRVKSVEVSTRASRVPVSRDGEVEPMRGPLRYRIGSGDLQVLTPVRAEG